VKEKKTNKTKQRSRVRKCMENLLSRALYHEEDVCVIREICGRLCHNNSLCLTAMI
jgi:hypothetical protein